MDSSGGRREIVEAICAQLERDNDQIRWCAVKALGRLEAQDVLPTLAASLRHDPDPDVRMEIATVLGAWGRTDAVAALIAALNDDADDDVRLQACRALARIQDPRAAEALINCLAVHDALSLDHWDTGDDIDFSVIWELQREALDGLARIGGTDAVEAIIQLLHTEDDADLQGLGLRGLAAIGSQRAFEVVIEQLQRGSRTARQQAAAALASVMHESVIPPLLTALEDEEADVRIAAGWSLRSKAVPATFPALIKLLQDPEASVRGEAVAITANLSAPAVATPLIRTAYDPDRTVQQRAIEALGERCEIRASANLLALLARSQGDEVLANAVIKALGRIKPLEALEPLRQYLKSDALPPTARMQAVLALGEIAADTAGRLTSGELPQRLAAQWEEADPIDTLTDLVSSEDLQVAQAALLALSRIGGERAQTALVQALRGEISEPPCDTADAAPEAPFPTSTLEAIQAASIAEKHASNHTERRQQIRAYAAKILSEIDLPQARDLLRQAALDDSPQLRCAALPALGRASDDGEVVAIIAQNLGDASREARLAALQALAQMQSEDATPILLERLSIEPDALVKQRLLETIGHLGDWRATPMLITALNDEDRHVQRVALRALTDLADCSAITAVRPFLFAHGGTLWREALTTLQSLQDSEIAVYLLDVLRQPEQEECHGIAIEALASIC